MACGPGHSLKRLNQQSLHSSKRHTESLVSMRREERSTFSGRVGVISVRRFRTGVWEFESRNRSSGIFIAAPDVGHEQYWVYLVSNYVVS